MSLIPGEPRDTRSLSDARHWAAVYDEFARTLRRFSRECPSAELLCRAAIADARLRWWLNRERELRAGGGRGPAVLAPDA